MARHSDYAAPTVYQAGRSGGISRAKRLSPERRRQIAHTASLAAASKRSGLPTTREVGKRFLARLEAVDPDLRWVMGVALKAPEHLQEWLIDKLDATLICQVERAFDDTQRELETERAAQ